MLDCIRNGNFNKTRFRFMTIKDTLSVAGGGIAGIGTSIAEAKHTVLGTNVEFWHLILYSFIGGCMGWLAKELLDFIKRKI